MSIGSPARSRRQLRLVGVVACIALYAIAFPPLFRAFGDPAAALILLPIIVAGLLFGRPGGVLVGVATPLVQLPLHAAMGSSMPAAALLLVTLPQGLLGATVGTLVELGGRLRMKRLELEDALERDRRAHEELERAQLLTGIGNWSWDVASGTMSWSSELHHLVGMPPGTRPPTFQEWMDRVHPADRAALSEAIAEGLRTGAPFEHDYRLVGLDGRDRTIHGRFQVRAGAASRRMLGTVQDVTEERLLQAQLAAVEQVTSLTTLAAGMAHELNNPLGFVGSSLVFLAEELHAVRTTLEPAAFAALTARIQGALQGTRDLGRGVAAFKDLVDAQADPETRT